MAEDDLEDQLLVRKAFMESRAMNGLTFVNDGEELLQYLRREGDYASAPFPDILLLDLNMPRKDGREALQEIKSDPELCSIPVVVLTTSAADEDIVRSYQLGANSYIQKPVTFEKMVEIMDSLGQYWLSIVKLPPNGG
ncbi:MAG: response regulator [Victivallales bacterium]|nr:response regulator [Victivallales bacterium]